MRAGVSLIRDNRRIRSKILLGKIENMEFLMAIVMLATLSAVLIVSGLIHFLMQLINAWCDPARPDEGINASGIAEEQMEVQQ